MKLTLALVISLFSFQVLAEGVIFKVKDLEGEIHSYGLRPENAQVVMRCQFIKNGVPTKYSQKRPRTRLQFVEQRGELVVTKISMKSTTLWDYLPGFDLHNCSFNLLVISRDLKTGGSKLTDLILMGQKRGQMSESELDAITDTEYVTTKLRGMWNPLVIK